MKHYQSGISFIGILFVGGVLACAGIVAAQVVPTVIEYQAITKAATRASAESKTVAEVKGSFDRAAAVDDIKSIAGKDLIVTKDGEKTVVAFAYNREIHLAGPAYLLMKYQGQSK